MPRKKLLEKQPDNVEVSGEQEVNTVKQFCTLALIHSVNEKQLQPLMAANLICDWFGDEAPPLLEELYKQITK